MAIQLSKNGNAVKFDFDDNSHYLNDGTIEVPVNSLTLVTDESDMFTFKKAASDDIFISGLYEEIGMSKSELIAWYKDNMVGSTGGGGGVTSGDVQTMIDESVSGLSDDISSLSGDVANKADTTAVTASINSAVSGKMDTSAFNTYSASTDARLSEDEEVTSAALNELNDALDDKADTSAVTASIAAAVSGKQDTLVSGTNIKTINNESLLGSGNIDIQGGGKSIVAGTNISVTTGETADTVNCTLPIFVHSDNSRGDIRIGTDVDANSDYFRLGVGRKIHMSSTYGRGSVAIGVAGANSNDYNLCYGENNVGIGRLFEIGTSNNSNGVANYCVAIGSGAKAKINNAVAIGSGAVASGTTQTNINNQIKIDTNNQIYIKDKTNTNEICLQDALGGGGLPESAFTAYTASTDARLAEDEEVTAAALNTLNTATAANTTALGGLKLVQLTQAEYEALTTKDASTLYIITSSN